MDRFAALEAFVRVAEAGSFSQAARMLRLSPSVVSKRVADLERDYGVVLLRRTTRRVALTDAGETLLERAVAALAVLEDARHELGAEAAEPRGRLRVGAPTSFGSLILGPAICEFRAGHPGVEVELVLVDRAVHPDAEGFDVVVDDTGMPPGTAVARALTPIRRVACAAPAYLAGHRAPRHPRDLRTHDCIHYSHLESGLRWRFHDRRGRPAQVRVRPVVTSNNGRVMLDAAIAGQGVALVPTFLAAPSLAAGALVRVLDRWSVAEIPLAVVYTPSAYRPLRARRMVEFLVERFSADPPPWEC